jgi:hypothetical protein
VSTTIPGLATWEWHNPLSWCCTTCRHRRFRQHVGGAHWITTGSASPAMLWLVYSSAAPSATLMQGMGAERGGSLWAEVENTISVTGDNEARRRLCILRCNFIRPSSKHHPFVSCILFFASCNISVFSCLFTFARDQIMQDLCTRMLVNDKHGWGSANKAWPRRGLGDGEAQIKQKQTVTE